MSNVLRRCLAVLGGATLAVLGSAAPASAHLHQHVDGYDTTVGWEVEPAYIGYQNAVSFAIRQAAEEEHAGGDEHAAGAPAKRVKLQVEVFFGAEASGEKLGPLDLTPVFGSEDTYHATVVPTDPGTYTFRIFGTVAGEDFEQSYTSGEAGAVGGTQYNDVSDTAAVQFPNTEPDNGELADRIQRTDDRLVAASDDASSAGTLAIVGIVVGALGLLAGLGSLLARGKARAA
ncbi:MAG TPA: hypothetical protein VGB83_09375 [Actinomycetota bacterium]